MQPMQLLKVVFFALLGVSLFAIGVALAWAGVDLRLRIGGADGITAGVGYVVGGLCLILCGLASVAWAVVTHYAERRDR